MANFNFKTTLSLNSKEFRAGVNEVKKSLASLKTSFMSFAGALGAGLGLTQVISSIKKTATELSVAQNTLKNVSTGFGEYGENMAWLQKISNKYGQDVVNLTNQFAQFRAAAADTNLSLDDLKGIYESLTRAAGAYHMSADRTKDMMMAVTQMFSKGTVTAEELRRQLGNSLPGAFNIMAKAAQAAGVTVHGTTAELEKAMKSGKVRAEQVLPAFGKMLNEATRGADFDSLQTSMNRLSNAWANLVDKGGFEKSLKSLVDFATKGLNTIGEHIKGVKALLISLATIPVANMFKGFAQQAVKENEIARKQFDETFKAYHKTQKNIKSLEQKGFIKKGTSGLYHIDKTQIRLNSPKSVDYVKNIKATKQDLIGLYKTTIKFNEEANKIGNLSKYAKNKVTFLSDDDLKRMKKAVAQLEKTNSVSYQMFEKTSKLGVAFRRLGSIIGSAFSSIAFSAIISAITFLITKTVQWIKELKEAKNYVKNVVKEVQEVYNTPSEEITSLTMLRDAIASTKGDLSNSKKLINDINNALGRTGKNAFTVESNINDIISACDIWLKRLKRIAQQEAVIGKIKELYSKQIMLTAENEQALKDPNWGRTETQFVGGLQGAAQKVVVESKEAGELRKKVTKNNEELANIQKSIDALLNLKEYQDPDFIGPPQKILDKDAMDRLYGGGMTGGNTPNTTPDSGKPKGAKKVYEDYYDNVEKLNNQLKSNIIGEEAYNEALNKLITKTAEELGEYGDFFDKKKYPEFSKKERENYTNLRNELVPKAIAINLGEDDASIKALDEEIAKEADEAYNKVREAAEKWNDFIQDNKPKLKERDKSEDYKYSKIKRKGEQYSDYDLETMQAYLEVHLDNKESLESWIKELQSQLNSGELGEDMTTRLISELEVAKMKLKELGVEMKDLPSKIKVATLEDEINELQKSLKEGMWSSITSVADGFDRLQSSVESIKDTFDDVDATEFEKVMAIINGLIQSIEVLTSVVEAFTAVKELSAKLAEKNALKVAAANTIEAASEEAKGSAAGAAAVAQVASSVAGTPFIGGALAGAAVAALVALIMNGMGKFADGGVVSYGSSSGDKTLARVNKGEGILTAKGLKNLNTLYNNQGSGGGNVIFEIRGDKLVGVLNNYNSKKRG